MSLVRSTYGKGRVRVMRIHKVGDRQDVRELTVKVMLEGDFARSYTAADNTKAVATDTMKNIVNICARKHLDLETEPFCQIVAKYFLEHYPQVEKATVSGHETKWTRLAFGGKPHAHSFVLDSNGKPFGKVTATRTSMTTVSGIEGYTFMKSTASGWTNYVMDEVTTIPETRDRMAATAMDASWVWSKAPEDYPAANAKILSSMIEVFATTYSESVQDSLYRMGTKALALVPEISEVSMACPNKHYLLMNLAPFGLDNDNQVFLPTDEPHGQIECTVGRG
jgi:urate oxidase